MSVVPGCSGSRVSPPPATACRPFNSRMRSSQQPRGSTFSDRAVRRPGCRYRCRRTAGTRRLTVVAAGRHHGPGPFVLPDLLARPTAAARPTIRRCPADRPRSWPRRRPAAPPGRPAGTAPRSAHPRTARRGVRNLRTRVGSPAGVPKPTGRPRPPARLEETPIATRHHVGGFLATGEASPPVAPRGRCRPSSRRDMPRSPLDDVGGRPSTLNGRLRRAAWGGRRAPGCGRRASGARSAPGRSRPHPGRSNRARSDR